MQSIVSDHEQYLDALRDFNDWLISAKEELQRWSDLSGDSISIQRKLSKLQVRLLTGLFVDTSHFMIVPSSPCCLLSVTLQYTVYLPCPCVLKIEQKQPLISSTYGISWGFFGLNQYVITSIYF